MHVRHPVINDCADPFPVVLTDLKCLDGDGFKVLAAAKERSPATEVIVMTAFHEHAYDAMRNGAYDFVSKPFPSLREVLERVGKAYEKATIVAENELLRVKVGEVSVRPWIARSGAMRKIMEIGEKIASTRTTVLITGESGTGKERVARLLHDHSDRARRPFVAVNCGALPEALMESELFGHERGAFTGASSKHSGMLREAEGGTLLLDEVGELPMPLQVKLLRVLQERKVRAVGASTESDVDVRILAATNRDIEAQVQEGTFRKDLYYRLNVIRIDVPRCATAARTCPCSRTCSSDGSPQTKPSPFAASPRWRSANSPNTDSPATCVSSRTCSSAQWHSRTARSSRWEICRKRCETHPAPRECSPWICRRGDATWRLC